MERIRKSATLKQTYYHSFLLLVVIPLVLVFVGAEVAIGYIIRSSARATIDALQEKQDPCNPHLTAKPADGAGHGHGCQYHSIVVMEPVKSGRFNLHVR